VTLSIESHQVPHIAFIANINT